MEKEKSYSVKAIPKDGSESYLIYDGWVTSDKGHADLTCKECNKLWGSSITYEVIENE